MRRKIPITRILLTVILIVCFGVPWALAVSPQDVAAACGVDDVYHGGYTKGSGGSVVSVKGSITARDTGICDANQSQTTNWVMLNNGGGTQYIQAGNFKGSGSTALWNWVQWRDANGSRQDHFYGTISANSSHQYEIIYSPSCSETSGAACWYWKIDGSTKDHVVAASRFTSGWNSNYTAAAETRYAEDEIGGSTASRAIFQGLEWQSGSNFQWSAMNFTSSHQISTNVHPYAVMNITSSTAVSVHDSRY